MSAQAQPLWMAATMVLAGMGIPLMAALNGGLGLRLGSPVMAATILFALALIASITLLSLQPGGPRPGFGDVPVYFYLGGLLVAFYVLAVTRIAPVIGVGNAIMLVLMGQLMAAAAIDHLGLLGAPRAPLSAQRAGGIATMLVGIVLARWPDAA